MAKEHAFQARLSAARAGDATAWSQLYHDVVPLLIGYLRAQRLAEPEDVAGEVMLEVVRDIHRFEGDARRFRSWVLAIAHHRLLDARRRESRRPSTAPGLDGLTFLAPDDPEGETIAASQLRELDGPLARLTDDQRAVLLLRAIGDLPLEEVARVLDKRVGAIKQLQRRAVDRMRQALDESQDRQEDDAGHAGHSPDPTAAGTAGVTAPRRPLGHAWVGSR